MGPEVSPAPDVTFDHDSPLGDILKQIESVRQQALQPKSRASGKSAETPPGLVKRTRMDFQRTEEQQGPKPSKLIDRDSKLDDSDELEYVEIEQEEEEAQDDDDE